VNDTSERDDGAEDDNGLIGDRAAGVLAVALVFGINI